MITERVYKHKDNLVSLSLEEDGDGQDISAASRMVLQVGPVTIDSNTATSGAFDWTTYGENGRLDLKLGHEREIINLSKGVYLATITVYDATYAKGLVWDEFKLEVS